MFFEKDFKIVSLVRNGSEYRNRMQRSSKDVVKSYIDLLNGKININSKENIGTTITFVIPFNK